ncbi:MAG: hypothetical protein Kow0099_27070 [Candidatus Abyssubacteria bacterium]
MHIAHWGGGGERRLTKAGEHLSVLDRLSRNETGLRIIMDRFAAGVVWAFTPFEGFCDRI